MVPIWFGTEIAEQEVDSAEAYMCPPAQLSAAWLSWMSQLQEPNHSEGWKVPVLTQEGWDVLGSYQLQIKATDPYPCFPWCVQEQGDWSLEVPCCPQALQCWEHSAQPAGTDAVEPRVNPWELL